MRADSLERNNYYKKLQALVEEMYISSGGKRVSLVVHSMGGPLTLHFLNQLVTEEWKDKYIHAFIPIAGAWSGGNTALQSLVSGLSAPDMLRLLSPNIDAVSLFAAKLGCPAVNNALVRDTVRTFQSMYFLLPKPSVWEDEVLLSTPTRNYTAKDYSALFNDIGYPQGYEKYTGISEINDHFPAPGVPVYCFYGVDLPTREKFRYDKGFNSDPTVTMGTGDGMVNIRSSQVCHNLKPTQIRTYTGVDHLNILKDTKLLRDVESVVFDPRPVVCSRKTNDFAKDMHEIHYKDSKIETCLAGLGAFIMNHV